MCGIGEGTKDENDRVLLFSGTDVISELSFGMG